MGPYWLSAFLDFRDDAFRTGVEFWSAVTGFAVSPLRGGRLEFATLVPPQGDDYLRVQRLDVGPSRIHLDVHVPDPSAAAARAVALGAKELDRRGPEGSGYVVLSSPGGLVFCFVRHPGAVRPLPAVWPDGHRSMVYQVCLDLPAAAYDAELGFWQATLEAMPEVLTRRQEFSWLRTARQQALDVLVQRLDRLAGPVSAHLDLGTNDRAAEVARHVELGADALVVEEFWTVMRCPAGLTYCVTDRDPVTGRLG